ncbi:hypothetical protein K2F43_04455 [Clostridium estertheticum]|uniref:hypothetical protein n=1 Tax=Clostridium estertheticum TaxID=238834 RepID=UPI001C6F13C0|nr:hypothetical protein [Clostridium estertheticum]MBW9170456.1 hypothetical protein [Clostridium estertheticum]WLC75083.1 hypothetical protein KTC99_20555 [Clostridium estertheticum]
MKKRYTLIVISVWLIFLLTACAKQESKQMVTSFENIPIASAKSIEFSNYTIRSENKELGRTKTVTKKQDMESIVKYIKTLSCTKGTKETNGGDYSIRLRDVTGKYIYSIQVSKNQICLYERGTDTTISIYDYKDTKLINELERVYKDINYKEVFIVRK